MILVDAHVHLRSCFEPPVFLDEAYRNFVGVSDKYSDNGGTYGVLCLVTSPNDLGFGWLTNFLSMDRSQNDNFLPRMSLTATQEEASVCLSLRDGGILVVVAGRQVVSSENLEVLAIGTCEQFESGTPTPRLIKKIVKVGAIPIIPWGAGKWMGKRGRLVDELVESSELPPFFLGDSGNRPAFWPRPTHFRRAEDKGIKILSGSDPLPFPGEAKRVGSFGVALKGSLDAETPAQDLKRKVLDPSTVLHQFGSAERPLRFLRNQLKMQFRKFIR